MKISIVATTVLSLAASAAANIVLPTDETPDTGDATTNTLIEMAMANGSDEVLDHLNAFSALKEGALNEEQRRRLQDGDDADQRDDADQHQRELSKNSKCFFGFATEAFKHTRGDTYTWEDSTKSPQGRIYFWGTNGVCDDESTGAIDRADLPTKPYDSSPLYPSYCAEEYIDDDYYTNAPLIGSATGHCFISPTYIENDFGGNVIKCDIGSGSICDWSCQEILVINNFYGDDYIFLEYIFRPNPGNISGKGKGGASPDQGAGPHVFDVVVTGGTGCYKVKNPTIIKGYTGYQASFYVYDLKGIKNGKKAAKQANTTRRRLKKTAKSSSRRRLE